MVRAHGMLIEYHTIVIELYPPPQKKKASGAARAGGGRGRRTYQRYLVQAKTVQGLSIQRAWKRKWICVGMRYVSS